jgi:ketosteroid isomerase-like protein
MGAKENLELVEELRQAARDQDFNRYGSLLAEDVVFRMAGVPGSLGGVTKGRQAIVDQMRQLSPAGSFEVKEIFGDDHHVCVVGKMTADRFPGNQYLRSAERPYSTYQCTIYRITDGKVAESISYVNWLDAYVQAGLVDVKTLTP